MDKNRDRTEILNSILTKCKVVRGSIHRAMSEASGGSLAFHAKFNRFKFAEELTDKALADGDTDSFVLASRDLAEAGVDWLRSARRVFSSNIAKKPELDSIGVSCRKILSDVEGCGVDVDSENKINFAREAEKLSNEAVIKLRSRMEEYDRHDARYQKLLSESSIKIEDIGAKLEGLTNSVEVELNSVKSLYDSAVLELELKKQEVNKLLGLISGATVAGSFEDSARSERSMADIMRWISIACMGAIVLVVSYSLWLSLSRDFDWRVSMFNMVFAVILSVPSAYLARESAKHRDLHNKHLQLSLELKAINPYIASLPVDEQHKIKSDIASRMFCVRDGNQKFSDPYPLNMQEIVMEILKKIEFKGKN